MNMFKACGIYSQYNVINKKINIWDEAIKAVGRIGKEISYIKQI